MSVTLEDLQPHVEKEAVLHLKQDDGSLKEVTGTIKAATVAGVPFKTKGKAGIDLLTVDQIEEVAAAPPKAKSVTQKKIDLVADGGMRQHLADRHGIELEWCKNATEEQAVEFHNGIDHSKLGHVHVDKKAEKEKSEREQALAAESGSSE